MSLFSCFWIHPSYLYVSCKHKIKCYSIVTSTYYRDLMTRVNIFSKTNFDRIVDQKGRKSTLKNLFAMLLKRFTQVCPPYSPIWLPTGPKTHGCGLTCTFQKVVLQLSGGCSEGWGSCAQPSACQKKKSDFYMPSKDILKPREAGAFFFF